jgi:phosphatidylglycerophosphate synthase
MRYFRHTIAEYTCVKRCGYHRSVPGANWSLFHLICAVAATVPLWLFSLYEEFPWYYIVSILAGELLLIYCAGFLSSFVTMPFTGTSRCKQCGAPMLLCGRHFDPAGSLKPHWSDIAIFVVFVGLNVVVWISLVSGNL